MLAFAGAAQAVAQSRGEVRLQDVGYLRTVGSGAGASFQNYSFGLGSLSASYGSPTVNVLQSSLNSPATFSLVRPSAEAGSAGVVNLPRLASAKQYGTAGPKIADVGGSNLADAIADNRPMGPAAMTGIYLQAVGRALLEAKAGQTEPIVSLVPSVPSGYGTLMVEGERAFREGDFTRAFGKFQLANSVGDHDPESLLSMAHASFAMAQVSYIRPAYYLRQTLKYLPELPLLPLRPKEFYREPALYVEHLIALEKHLQQYPLDSDANLVMAYLSWFGERPEAASQYLINALQGRPGADMIEAIETFWAGMVASGKVTGSLSAAALAPSPQSQPADEAVPPAQPGQTASP